MTDPQEAQEREEGQILPESPSPAGNRLLEAAPPLVGGARILPDETLRTLSPTELEERLESAASRRRTWMDGTPQSPKSA